MHSLIARNLGRNAIYICWGEMGTGLSLSSDSKPRCVSFKEIITQLEGEKYPLALMPLKTWQFLWPRTNLPRLYLRAKNNPTEGGVGSFWHFFFQGRL